MINLDPSNEVEWRNLADAYESVRISGFNFVKDSKAGRWQKIPLEEKELFLGDIPVKAKEVKSLVSIFDSVLLNYSNGNTHPSFFGWVHGGGNLYGALGELCAALLNNNSGGRDHIAHQVERQVLQWCREMFCFPANSSGLLTSGTSMATVIALAVARQDAVGPAMKTQGLQGNTTTLVGYCSSQSHNSVLKAFQLLGLGGDALRAIPVNDDFTLNTQALAEQVAADHAAGVVPFCVIATVGTVNTGAIDDVNAIHALCQQENLWLHIDAAFGGAVALLDEYQTSLDGIQHADSIAFDFHKWFQVPYAVGGLLVKDAATHQATFSERKEYLASEAVGLSAGAPWFCDLGPELSRGFLALKVWFTFQGLGTERMAAVVRKHCQLAQATAKQIDDTPTLERLAPVPMNIVCCRYVPQRLESVAQSSEQTADYLHSLNKTIVTQLQLQGLAAPSTTTLHGQLAIRIAIVNHRTESVHLTELVEAIQQLGERIDSHFAPLLNPTHWHLMQGGDERLLVDPDTGLNRYGCSPSPRDNAFTFASSTATSVSTPAYQAADAYRQQILHDCVQANDFIPLANHCRELEADIANTLGIADLMPDLHLSPSGTDAQLHVAAAVTTATSGNWVSIVCGSDETGSGTPFSVTGRHFDATTCLGKTVAKGERLAEMPPIAFSGIPFRADDGHFYTLQEMDERIEAQVVEEMEKGRHVMLHAMDQSKFGCWAPSPSLLDRLRQCYGERIQVIIDACQLRIDAKDLRDHLAKGDILLITGSKFFTGPPFSGAAIFPQALSYRLSQCGKTLPSGLNDYLPKADLGIWEALLPDAPSPLTIGMYLRWYAALTEAKRYYEVPKEKRIAGLDGFGLKVMQMLDQHPYLEALIATTDSWWARTEMSGDELSIRRSIFPFLIRSKQGHYLSQEQVKTLYEQLNRDMSDHPGLTENEKALAAQCCHIGQPVKIDSENTAALRVSIGARIISDGLRNSVYDIHHWERELKQISFILTKISLCVKKFIKS